MSALLIAAVPIVAASLLGSPHCAGMCGGFVAIYSHHARGKFLPHILYSLGRLITYCTLGLAAAAFGASIDSFTEIGRASALLVGAALVVLGVVRLIRGPSAPRAALVDRMTSLVGKVAAPLMRSESILKPLLIGVVTTLLPCGWLYTFVALAMAAARPAEALVIMAAFWAGTLPVMLSLGALSRMVIGRFEHLLPRITALLIILGGLLSIGVHLQHAGHSSHLGHAEHAAPEESRESPGHLSPPAHHHSHASH